MGGLSPLAGAIVPGLSGIIPNPLISSLIAGVSNLAFDDYSNQKNLKRQTEQKRLSQVNQQAKANARLNEINTQSQLAEEERIRNLKSAIAKQRASFASSGISSNGKGSAKAVLSGFLNDSEEEKKANDKFSQIKKQAISDNLYQNNQKSLLELSQLEERQDIDKYTNIF